MVVLYTAAADPLTASHRRGTASARPCSSSTTPTTRQLLDRAAALARLGRHAACWSSAVPAARATGGLRRPAARRLALGPLERRGRGDRQLYVPAGFESLADALAAESGGVPLAVHRAGGGVGRARASAAVGASAGRAAGERGELRAAEADLSADLLALRPLTSAGGATGERTRRWRRCAPSSALPRSTLPTPSTSSAASAWWPSWSPGSWVRRCWPWSARPEAGSPRRSGRPAAGAGRGRAARFRALAPGADAPGGSRWPQLQRVLPERGERSGLVVDQFEEVFTVGRDEAERDALPGRPRRAGGATASGASGRPRDPRRLLRALRRPRRLARLVGANQVLVGPMRRDELRRAIEQPARRVGLRSRRPGTR